MSRKTLLMSVLLTVSLTACASGEADRLAPTDQAVPSAVEETSTGPTHSLPVASAFGEPAWGTQVPPSWEQMTPVITAQRVIALSDATVVAYDAQGAEAWSTDWQPLAEEDRAVGTPPVLRQVSPEVVAVIDTGKVEGEGLSTSTFAAQVTRDCCTIG